jgi:formate hydrogenlyase subunit 3/multisubunit Na+/H+ antiporter MnhD subunit
VRIDLLAVTGVLLLAAAVVDLAWGAGRPRLRPTPYVLAALASATTAAAGVLAVLSPARTLDLGTLLELGRTTVRLDPLTGLFLTLVGLLGVAVSVSTAAWVSGANRAATSVGVAAGYALLLASVVVVLVAGDVFSFLLGWESLTLSFYILTGQRARDRRDVSASWLALVTGRLSGALLLVGFLLLATQTHSFQLTAFVHAPHGRLHTLAACLVIAGFAAKVGAVPLQVWMPRAYPRAPGPLRAALAGLAVNVGFYGLWRFLPLLGPLPEWLVVTVLVDGGLTAVLGVAFAAVDDRLNRLVAFSSVENAGLILTAFGVALAGETTHQTALLAAGILAASLQVLAHAVAKTTLFLSGSVLEADRGTDRLEEIRGVGREHPLAAGAFALGALTLAGLPPTIGFASEWFVLEALMQQFRLAPLALRLGMATGGALVALTAGLAALAFARLVGVMLLGPPGAERAATAQTGGPGGLAGSAGRREGDRMGRRTDVPVADAPEVRRVGHGVGRSGATRATVGVLGVLGGACVGLAVVAPLVVSFLVAGLAPVVPSAALAPARKSPWVLQPVERGFSILSPTWFAVLLAVGVVAVTVFALAASRGGILRVRRVPPWRSASLDVGVDQHYSAFGYANALRHVLGNLLGASRHVVVDEDGTAVIETSVAEPTARYLYAPLRRGLLWLSDQVRRLQSGRLEAYVAYMLAALVAVLVAAAVLR